MKFESLRFEGKYMNPENLTVSENECHTPSKELYGNEVSLNEKNLPLKWCQSFD